MAKLEQNEAPAFIALDQIMSSLRFHVQRRSLLSKSRAFLMIE